MDGLALTGCTVAVTAERRRAELADLLRRRGAQVLEAPALRIVPAHEDPRLRAATDACCASPLDLVVVTTAVGFRGWLEAADGWLLGEPLRDRLRHAGLVVRGPKALGAVRGAGLREAWVPDSEATGEVLDRLLAEGVAGRRIAVQLHGEPLPGLVEGLRAAGAEVLEVPVYRWEPPEDPGPLRDLVGRVARREVDCVTFTSAPAATSVLRTADALGLGPELRQALAGRVLAACVGPVTAAPLQREGIPVLQPDRARLAALVRAVAEELPRHRTTGV